MKRTLLTSLALTIGLAASADAQSRYGYQNESERIERNRPPVRRPILNRIVGDLRIAGEEIDKGLFEMRDELRRLVHGRQSAPPVEYYEESFYPDEPEYGAGESFGHFSPDTLERARRRSSNERERFDRREAAIRRDLEREREFARPRATEPPTGIRVPEGTAPPVIVRPLPESIAKVEPQRQPTPPEKNTPPAPNLPTENIAEPEPDSRPPLSTIREPIAETSSKPEPEKQPTATRTFTEAEKRNFPLATKADKPGHVRSPYPPFQLLDISGLEPGGLAMEPEGDRIFRIPK